MWRSVQKILLVLEHNGEEISEPSLRICVNINRSGAGELAAVVFGDCPAEALKTLGGYGIREIFPVPGQPEDFYSPEQRLEPLTKLIASAGSAAVIFPGTLAGRELAPLMAVRLDAGLVTDCQQLHNRQGSLEAVLSVYGGQYQEVCEFSGRLQVILMADVNCGKLPPAPAGEPVITPTAGIKAAGGPVLKVLETFQVPATELDIGEADIVVGIGRGVETKEDYRQMAELAAAIGAPIGGTRPAVDAEWITFEKQIGQTGRIVAPELYVAAGISGAVQHITGVEKAKIVAINSDPQAPILCLADLGVVGDFRTIVPLVSEKLRAARKEGQH